MSLKPQFMTFALAAGVMLVGGALAPSVDAASKPAVQTQKAVKEVYTCPMDPEVVSDKPGRCPKCKMHLEKTVLKVDPKKAKHDHSKHQVAYVCPMHPEVTSDKPGRCPECKMFLEKAKK